jgi:predicted RNase H-like HicB family nuclease
MTELNIRYNEDEQKYYVYFEDPWGNCMFQSDAFDTLEEAEEYQQEQLESAEDFE